MKQINQLNSTLMAVFLTAAFASTVFAELPDPDGKPADLSKPVKVFIIMGQSNTLEMGRVATRPISKVLDWPIMINTFTGLDRSAGLPSGSGNSANTVEAKAAVKKTAIKVELS